MVRSLNVNDSWDFIAENNWHIDKKTKMAEDEKQQCM